MGNFQQKIEFVSVISKNQVSFFEQLLAALDGKMVTPTLYGWYHLLCLAIMAALIALVVCKAKGISDKNFNLVIGITSGILILLEIYKQLNYSYSHTTDTWSYQWYAFPFQFCSTPMYVMLLATFLKNGKVKTCLCSFLATYGLFAGSAVMLYPGDVFIRTIGINIQTMVHHGMMVVIGVFMYVSGRVKLSHKTILHALPVFASLVAIALTANLLYGAFGDPEQTFNMFFISPYYACHLPILSDIYNSAPYIVFLLLYVFGFSAAAYVMSLLAMGVNALSIKIQDAFRSHQFHSISKK